MLAALGLCATVAVIVASVGLCHHISSRSAPVEKRKRPSWHPLPSIVVNMESSNGNTPLPEDMNKPPEGVVVPPKDIRGRFFLPLPLGAIARLTSYLAIVEKTAGYVARNGAVFEGKSASSSLYLDSEYLGAIDCRPSP